MNNGGSGSAGARWLVLVDRAVLLLVGAVAMLPVLAGCAGTSPASGEQPPEHGSRSEELHAGAAAPSGPTLRASEGAAGNVMTSGISFESLDQMVATADLVVTGTVEEVRPGEVDAAGEPGEVRHSNTVVKVEEVLKGQAPEGYVVVKTLEDAYSGPQNKEWRNPGERVLLFLTPSLEQQGLYIMAETNLDQTAYIREDGNLSTTRRDGQRQDELAEQVASLSMPELKNKVKEAKDKEAKGEVKPKRREL